MCSQEKIEHKIRKLIATETDENELRSKLFGSGGEFEKAYDSWLYNPDTLSTLFDQAISRISELQKQEELKRAKWDEFKDKNFAEWKRVRASIEHENHLLNHRLTWLFNSNAFLFTLFGVLLQKSTYTTDATDPDKYLLNYLFLIISMLGMFTSFVIGKDIGQAIIQIRRTHQWWNWRIRSNENLESSNTVLHYPPIYESSLNPLHKNITVTRIADLLCSAWVFIVFLVIGKLFENEFRSVLRIHSDYYILGYILIIVISLIFLLIRFWLPVRIIYARLQKIFDIDMPRKQYKIHVYEFNKHFYAYSPEFPGLQGEADDSSQATIALQENLDDYLRVVESTIEDSKSCALLESNRRKGPFMKN
jgi:hypothetical protein